MLAATLRSEHDDGRSAYLPAYRLRGPKTMSSRPARRARDATFALASACAMAGTLRAECSTCPRLCALLAPGLSAVPRPASPPFPACLLGQKFTYAWPRDDDTVDSDREPVALFTGEAVHAYLGHLLDAAIEEMLNELATELGAALGQERIYVAFADWTWILDVGEHRG